MTPDQLEHYARTFHEQGRMTVNAEREKPFNVRPWAERTDEEREIDMRGASAVAAQAVHDAGLENERMKAQLFALAAHMPAIRRALTIAATVAEYEHEAKQYRAVLQALGISDEKETPPVKLIETILAVAVGLCGLGSATAASVKLPGLAAFLAGAGGFLCSAWLLMRTL